MTTPRVKVCKDCLADGVVAKNPRPANFPGPRCHTHHTLWTRTGKLRAHRRRVEENFGLGPGGYDELLAIQEGRCGGCGKPQGSRARRMAVDHDHTCCPGKTSCGRCVRGLLCYRCNDTLAAYRDHGEMLRGLADYLENWPSRRRATV